MIPAPIKIICTADYFLPGFKGGGPIRTIANMRKLLADSAEISVFTRDRDLGSDSPYDNVPQDCWVETEDGPVYYASPANFSASGLMSALAERHFDIIYLNSFFSFHSSIQVYFALRKAQPRTPILLAPRGEFSGGALNLKWFKKYVFLCACRALGFYNDLSWHASTSEERDDIIRQFPTAAERIHIAEDPVDVGAGIADAEKRHPSPKGQLRLAFISRISPMKNLDGLLQTLVSSTHLVELDVYGPIEDTDYWRRCQKLIDVLPANVSVAYKGGLKPDAVSPTFADYDLFAFPTHGENFGHVIFEALRAGTPVLLSDRTPWKADGSGAISAIPFANAGSWSAHLKSVAEKTVDEKLELRRAARATAEDFAKDPEIALKNLSLFLAVMSSFQSGKPSVEATNRR